MGGTPPLPRSVRILGSRAQVRSVQECIKKPDGTAALGECDMDLHRMTVVMGPDSDLVTQQQTLLHEIMHAIIQESGLAFMYEGEQQEHVVNTLTVHLLAVLKENRKVVQFLLGRYWL